MSNSVLELKNIGKTFSAVNVLRDIDLSVKMGDIHCLIGENGAGKSTLIKILSGYHQPDPGGEIYIDGQKVVFNNPKDAINASIMTIYQELTLCPLMTVAENICLNIQDRFEGVFQAKKQYTQVAEEVLARIGHPEIDPGAKVAELSIAKQQLVEIAKALVCNAKILLMDEPTSSIANQDIESLFEVIRKLKREGVTIIYISHKMAEITELADKVTVLRDGNLIGTINREDIDQDTIISMMVGRTLTNAYPKANVDIGEVTVEVENLSTEFFRNVNFNVHRGEVFGITGLVGSRRTEILDALFGRLPVKSGHIKIHGKDYAPKNPRNAIDRGIAYITEDRRVSGLVLCRPVDENLNMVVIQDETKLGLIDRKEFADVAEKEKADMDIRLNSVKQLASTLSGGNQQKVVIGKWMASEPNIILLDEPTRGIDIKAKAGIYELLGKMVQSGFSVIMVSSELQEILNVSDRIMVMCEGEQKAILKTADTNQEEIMGYAMP